MRNYRFIYLLYILLFPAISYGQDTPRQEIDGKLLVESKNLHLGSIYVYNKQSKKGILSDSLGDFRLALRLGDTVVASAMQIEPSQIVVEEMHLNDAYITFPIQANIEYLEEVRLSNRSLTGNFDLDMKMLKTKPIVTSGDLGFPVPTYNMTVGERMLGSYTSSPAELLFAALSGELKKIKRRIALEKLEGKRRDLRKRMPNSYYSRELKIISENIPHFLEFCESRKDIDTLISMSTYDFIELLEKTAALYKDNFPERF
ncbi:MAG TPA: hypothetical protein VKX30_07480 [Flavobacteriaceae bacterium]|nr:hypothetical protein [Flavobacteriaceae bacterium]